MISIFELQRSRESLTNQPIKAYSPTLSRVANYYIYVIPSEINTSFVLETEKILNDLYLKAIKTDIGTQHIQEILLNALSIASSLSLSIRQHSYGPEFFMRAKVLGRTLHNVSEILE